MIANVFELSEYAVGDLMVPLSEVTALPEDTSLGEAALEVADKQHSRMPVYRSRVDDIVGVVHVFAILAAGPDMRSVEGAVAGRGDLAASLRHCLSGREAADDSPTVPAETILAS